ncbi:hypothetical protein LJC52_04135 [Bacteroidales bacterium OttesenSCG-928-A17]|nr:hypothetical protein [Bacteroidales bacterium OttesenSCG-928-A17]
MKKAIITFMISMCLLTTYAGIPKKIRNAFAFCYNNTYTGLDTLINIDGYFKEISTVKRSPTVGGFLRDTTDYYIQTSYHCFLFYDNGLYVYNIRDTNDKREEYNVSLYLEEILENDKTEDAKVFYDNHWGSYIVSGDTIKVQRLHKSRSFNDFWSGSEIWYKIIDKNTIQFINSIALTTDEKEKERVRNDYLPSYLKSTGLSVFAPLVEKPSYENSWILKEKWFWCNESDWEAYMEKIKQKKKDHKKK